MIIIESFREGGVFMYFILMFGIFTIGFVVERAIALYSRRKPLPENFRAQIQERIVRGDFNAISSYLGSLSNQESAARVVQAGISARSAAKGDEELQARMDEALSEEIGKLDKRTGFLAMFGNVATLLGLLGTISGMIHSFAAVASASPMDRAMMLSKGISEAMNCTAFGLIVAIPALVAYAIFQNRTDQLVSRLTEATTGIYHDLLFFTESFPSEIDELRSAKRASSRTAKSPELSV